MAATTLGQPLPWSGDEAGERRYAAILLAVLAPLLLLAILMPVLPLFEIPEEDQDKQVPERLAKLVIEQQEPEPAPEPAPEPERPQEEPQEQPEPTPEPDRQRAERSGVLAFADDLQDLRENQAAESVRQQRNLSQGQLRANQRRLITSNAGAGSTGIQSREGVAGGLADGTELAGRSDERVSGPPGGGRAGSPSGSGRGGGQAGRSLESIQIVFDRNKQALFSMYQRGLRSNPGLEGTVVLRLEIQPSGKVSSAEVVSSELNDPELEQKILNRVKLFDFGAKNVPVWRGRYPIEFFPS